MNNDYPFLFTWFCIIFSVIVFGNILQKYVRTNQKVEAPITCTSNMTVTITFPQSDKMYVAPDWRLSVKHGRPYSYLVIQCFTNNEWITITNIPSKW